MLLTQVPTSKYCGDIYCRWSCCCGCAYVNGYGLMGMVSSVVIVDWMSKMAMDIVKETQILGDSHEFVTEI